jgi:hypothetical protein
MDDDYSLLEYPDSEVKGDESSLNESTVVDSMEPAVSLQVGITGFKGYGKVNY